MCCDGEGDIVRCGEMACDRELLIVVEAIEVVVYIIVVAVVVLEKLYSVGAA